MLIDDVVRCPRLAKNILRNLPPSSCLPLLGLAYKDLGTLEHGAYMHMISYSELISLTRTSNRRDALKAINHRAHFDDPLTYAVVASCHHNRALRTGLGKWL